MPPKPKGVPKKTFQKKMQPAYHVTAPQQFIGPSVPLFQPCTFCQKSGADFQCSVCGALYCAVKCQLEDWQDHRIYRCIPRLQKATPVYVAPEFWAKVSPTLNTSTFPAQPAQEKNSTPPAQEIVFPRASLQNVPTQTAPPQRPIENSATRPAVEYLPQPVVQEYFAPRPSQQNALTRPALANFNMTPTQAIAKKPKQVVQQQQKSSLLVDFSKPPPDIKVPAHAKVDIRNNGESVAVNGLNMEKQSRAPMDKPVDKTTAKAADPSLKESILSAILPDDLKISTTLVNLLKMHPIKKRSQPVQFPEAGRKVRISHIGNDTIFFYGAGLEPDGTTNQYLSFMKRSLEAARETKQYLSAPPTRCDIVFAPFDGEYYRAGVKSIEGANATVIFPDFGNTATVAWAELKEINQPDIKYAPSLVFEAILNNVKQFTKPQKDFLKRLVEIDEFVITQVINMPSIPLKVIDLRHTQALYTLSDKLLALPTTEQLVEASVTKQKASVTGAEAGEKNEEVTAANVTDEMACEQNEEAIAASSMKPASIPEPENQGTSNQDTYTPVGAEEMQHCSLTPGQDVNIVVVRSTDLMENNIISVVSCSDIERFNKVKEETNRFGMRDPHPYQMVQEDEVCLIKRDGSWCRAVRCLKMHDEYMLFDAGCIHTLSDKSEVRRYPAELSRETFITDCIIDNPRMIKLIISADEMKNGPVGLILKADVCKKDEAFHIRIVDILVE